MDGPDPGGTDRQPPERRRLPFALPSRAPRPLTRGTTVPPSRAVLETAGLLLAYELVTGFLIVPELLELVAASLVFLWGLRRLDRITAPRLLVLLGLAGAGEAVGVQVVDPAIRRLLGYPPDFIALARGWWAGHRSVLAAGVYVMLPVLLLAYFNPGIRAELKAMVGVEGRGLDPLRSLAAAAVTVVAALSLLSTDLALDSVGYVHRYRASPAESTAGSATQPVATTPDPVAVCADDLGRLFTQAEAAADYDGDGRVGHQDVTQELARRIGAQDPRFQVLLAAYASFIGNRFQRGEEAALQQFREDLEDHCRSNGSSNGSAAASTDDEPSDVDSDSDSDADTSVTDSTEAPAGDAEGLADGLFCRDLDAQGRSYADAVAYYVAQGRPDRMDKDLNGIPCETVYSPADVRAYIDANGQP